MEYSLHNNRIYCNVITFPTLFPYLFQFRLLLAEDGSGKGAGLVAAIAVRLKQRFSET
jgi:hypothetical protein